MQMQEGAGTIGKCRRSGKEQTAVNDSVSTKLYGRCRPASKQTHHVYKHGQRTPIETTLRARLRTFGARQQTCLLWLKRVNSGHRDCGPGQAKLLLGDWKPESLPEKPAQNMQNLLAPREH